MKTNRQTPETAPAITDLQEITSGHDAAGQHSGRFDEGTTSSAQPVGAPTPTPQSVRMENARFWLAAIADSSDDAIVGKDLDGIITSWNKTAETLFGYTADEIIGQSVTRIIPPDKFDEETTIIERAQRGEKIIHLETTRQRRDGSIIPMSLTALPIRTEQGTIIGVSTTARDLTEMQRVHRDLERREALLHSILDTVPDALIVFDKQGLIKSFSVTAVGLFGYTAAETRGQPISVLLSSASLEQGSDGQPRYSATTDHPITGLGQRKDGSTFPMELTIGEVNLLGTQLYSAFVHDLTEQVARERELRDANAELERLARHLSTARFVADQSNKAKTRFLTSMSHELRTPLNGILGYAQLLRMEGGLNPVQSDRVNAMLQAGKHLLEMITRVLDLSEIEAERVELQPIAVDLLSMATGCLDLVRPAADAKQLALSATLAPGARREVVADPTRLRQILLNLLGNAVKFTSEGAVELRIRQLANGSAVRIEVADTGPGVPAEERRRLFREFERLDVEATRAAEGAGLGLALSTRLATLMGGYLGHRDNPGGGSVFWLQLPLDNAAPSPPATPPYDEAPAPLPPALHVLIADDVAMNRDIAGSFLRASGHRVTCVQGGAEAIVAAEATDFDVILMDVRMPEMDGLEATRRIRAIPGRRGQVPIVALTAQAFTAQVADCRKAGMDGHLPKPFGPESLLAAVLRAAAAGPTYHESGAEEPASDIGGIGSELPVFNPSAFERTASYLAPEVVTSYLEAIIECGEVLLRGLRGPDALSQAGNELAEAAHTIAGSAGMFGFERLTAVGRHFERAVQVSAPETAALADGLSAALEVTLQAIHNHPLVTVEE